MSFLFQRNTSPLAVLGGAVVALGLALALFQFVPTGEPERGGAGRTSTSTTAVAMRRASPHGADGVEVGADGGAGSSAGDAAPSLLPKGLSDPEGAGGSGIHRAVLKHGVWFPVFSPGEGASQDGSPGQPRRAEIPLAITTGTPAAGKTDEPFVCDFEAIGGSPPYRWAFQLGAAATGFTMDALTGTFSGSSSASLSTTLDVFVTDHQGAQASAHYPLTIVEESPLAIATGNLPAANAGAGYATRLEATGGTPPYRWVVAGLESTGLLLTPNTGEISGTPPARGQFALQVEVVDQAQNVVTRAMALEVTGTGPAILTDTLPDATADIDYGSQLTGEGGLTPYVWTLSGLPAGLAFDTATGAISGKTAVAGDFALEVTLTDRQGETATRSLRLKVFNGLDITSASPLFPASPQSPYQITFTATGGQPPYRWSLGEGTLPVSDAGASWSLSPDGVLSGVAGSAEVSFRFTIEVRDDAGRKFSKVFDLPVRRGLIAMASREKVGLAWRPAQMDAALRSYGTALAGSMVVRGNGGYPQSVAAGTVVFQGSGSNAVDRQLPVGGTYSYTLFALGADGRVIPYSTASATVLPMTLKRAQAGVTGDPYADKVVSFQPLAAGGFGSSFVPGNITGPPDGKGTFAPASAQSEVASLHARSGAGGAVILEFTNNIVELGSGPDFTVFENVLFIGGNATQRFMEPALVWVALFEGEWYRFPVDVVPPATGQPLNLMNPFYYNKGFAGRNGTTGSDPTNSSASGGDSFDINELAIPGLTWIRFIKLQSTGDNAVADDLGADLVRHTSLFSALSGAGSSGFDLDAISAVNY